MTAPALRTYCCLSGRKLNKPCTAIRATHLRLLPQVWQAAAVQCRHATESCIHAAGAPEHENVLLGAECSLLAFCYFEGAGTQALQVSACS